MARFTVALCLSVVVALVFLVGVQASQEEVVIWPSASDKPKAPESFAAEAYEVGVNGVSFFTLRTSAAGYQLIERAYIADLRLTEVLSRRLTGPVVIKPIRGKPTIYVGPVRVISVYPNDVAAYRARSAEELACKWAQALREGLPRVVPGALVAVSRVYEVAVNNHLLFRLRAAAGYPSVKARGAAVEQQVVEAMSRGAKAVTCAPTANGVGIYADGVLVVEVTQEDAAAAKSTPAAVAERWAENLRDALGQVSPSTPTAAKAS